MANFFVVVGKFLEEQYAAHLSDFTSWGQKEHANDYVLFPENIGEKLSFEDFFISRELLYTIVANKAAKGQKGATFAIVKGTESKKIIWIYILP